MERPVVSKGVLFFFILALVLICVGLSFGLDTFAGLEALPWYHHDHDSLYVSFREAAVRLLLFGNMVVVGIGILVITVLHLLHSAERIRRELEVLEKRNAEAQKLHARLQELSHHQRLETIGRLTASIAHEFNNLLTPIMGYSLMTLEKLPPDMEELQENLVEIYQSSRKAKEIISRLSELSRKSTESADRELSPDDLVRRTLAVVKPAKPENVEVVLDLNCWDQRLRANEIQLSQMLLNLVLNGFQAMEQGGGTLTIRTSYDADCVFFQVADTGCGIGEEVKPHIFEPFFTTKAAGKGTGLGLAIVGQMVENHRGRIHVESKLGQGTSFRVELPRNNDVS